MDSLDVDLCRAVAAARDGTKVKFSLLSAAKIYCSEFGEIDILSRNTTWTMTRDTQLGLILRALIIIRPGNDSNLLR